MGKVVWGSLETDLMTGRIVLEQKEDGDRITIFSVIYSTLLYPAILAIAVIAQTYLFLSIVYDSYKEYQTKQKIEKLDKLDDKQIEQKVAARIKKLQERIQVLKKQAFSFESSIYGQRVPEDQTPDTYFTPKKIQSIRSVYVDAREEYTNSEKTWIDIGSFVDARDRFEGVREFSRAKEEMEAYQGKTAEESREILRKRLELSIARRQISNEQSRHYMRSIACFFIPILGIDLWMSSKYTTKEALEASKALSSYNKGIKTYTWLKYY